MRSPRAEFEWNEGRRVALGAMAEADESGRDPKDRAERRIRAVLGAVYAAGGCSPYFLDGAAMELAGRLAEDA